MNFDKLKSELKCVNVFSPCGILSIHGDDDNIFSLQWSPSVTSKSNSLLNEAKRQLIAYFDKRLQTFDLPLKLLNSSLFQQNVLKQVSYVPYGKTITYGKISKALATSARAIGGACKRNPIPILIPCHRIIGENYKLTGYSGYMGTKTKNLLLKIEDPTINYLGIKYQ